MLTLVIVILHNLDLLPDLLEAWKQARVPGVTILQSAGGFQAETLVQRGGLAGLLKLFDNGGAQQRTIFTLIDDPDILEVAISEADRVVKGFDSPNSGILLTIPVDRALGLQKRPRSAPAEEIDEPPQPDKGTENLLSWFEEEMFKLRSSGTLKAWKSKKNMLVSKAIKVFDLKPTVVHVDTPIKEVIAAFVENPEVPLACVINSEDRLVGIIKDSLLAEMMLVPAMPEKIIQDPDGFDTALSYARVKPEHLAADIMLDPAYVELEGSIEDAFLKIRQAQLPGLPVVNKHYRIKGYLTLLELLAIYFPSEEEKK